MHNLFLLVQHYTKDFITTAGLLILGCSYDSPGVEVLLSQNPCGYHCMANFSCFKGFLPQHVRRAAVCLENASFNDTLACAPGEV